MIVPRNHDCELECAINQGPEIRTGFLKDEKPIKLTAGKEITITTDYSIKGDESLISMRCMILTMICEAILLCNSCTTAKLCT